VNAQAQHQFQIGRLKAAAWHLQQQHGQIAPFDASLREVE
jgi:hypothetical protein